MAGLSFKGSVQEVTQSTFSSTGPFQLNGVPSTGRQDRQTFVTALGNGAWAKYRASDANGNWEVGYGQITSGSPDTLSRTAGLVEEGSAGAGVLVDFPQGQVDLVCIASGYDVMPPKLSKAAAYTLTLLDRARPVEVNATSAPVTITLPSAATAGDGFVAIIGKVDGGSNAVTVQRDGSDTIAGGATGVAINEEFEFLTLRSDGTSNWRVVDRALAIKDGLSGTLTTTGSAGAYAVATNAQTAPYEGMPLRILANHTNPGGGATLDKDGSGADAIVLQSGADPYADAILDGGVYDFRRDASDQWVLLNPSPKAPVTTVYSSNDTWTKPSGLVAVLVEVLAAGGGGRSVTASAANANAGSGGGGGEYRRGMIAASALSATETVTVGAGGTAGNAGGNSSFGAHISSVGGGAGTAETGTGTSINYSSFGGAQGAGGSGGDYASAGGEGEIGVRYSGALPNGGDGGPSALGVGGLGGLAGSGGRGGGLGGGGGGGGSDSATARAGGAGGDGIVIVTEFYA